jgi:hypothetical protein
MNGALAFLLIIGLMAAEGAMSNLQRQVAEAPLSSGESSRVNQARKQDIAFSLTVANRRTIGLKALDIALTGSPNFERIVENLAPGREAVVAVPSNGKCIFDFHGVFDDGATTNAFALNLCKNTTINLFE